MSNKLPRLFLTLFLSIGFSTVAHAVLIDRGNGMIYDSGQNLTWLQDANYARTSGYDADGLMGWDSAIAWATGLSYGGYSDWRLPTVTNAGAPGVQCSNSGPDCGYNVNTSGSEMAYMWYDILGNTAMFDIDGNRTGCDYSSPWCLTSTSADGVDILNLQPDWYWLGTGYSSFTVSSSHSGSAWRFRPLAGLQHYAPNVSEYYAWAVRSGDVGTVSVPEPGTLLLMVAGLAGVAGVRRRYCRLG